MIYMVGAGPGATDLITVRGKELLKTADVIIYAGSLVNPEHIDAAKPDCEIYNSATMTLEEVTAVMKRATECGKDVVRLHTGDPSIYGAIREQMDRIEKEGMDVEIVPGVSSFCGAAASLKAEYTLPNVSQTVIITRMAGRTPVPEKESIRKLAYHQATMAVFLSTGMVDKLAEELIKGGYPKDTKAAIVYKATWPDEKVFKGTIETLPKIAADNSLKKTALILIGDFLGDEYERSLLYNPRFSHEFREAEKHGD